jgi:hypothetical protein
VAVSGANPYEAGVAQRTTLTEQQLSILRWIADGCPDGVMEGSAYRISAAALRSRGLLTISGRGRAWSARVTDAGREYLGKAGSPDPPVARQANVSVTQQLVDDVIAAGGTLRVPRRRWNDRDGVDYAHRARLAERHRKVPVGTRLVVVAASDEELEIRPVDAPELVAISALVPVVVPDRVGRYHEAARLFRDRSDHHEVSRDLVGRATRIIHAIAIEAERRRWSADAPTGSANRRGVNGWTGAKGGHLRIAAGGHVFWLRVQEHGVQIRGRWEEEVQRSRTLLRTSTYYQDRQLRSGAYDAAAVGRLKLELLCANYWIYGGRQSRWTDGRSWTLEERIPHLFREIEERIAHAIRDAEEKRLAADARAAAARREAEERERQWGVLMDQARARLAGAHRAGHLREQAADWHEADRLRRYCDAAHAAHGENPATREWLVWARSYIAELDPLSQPPVEPAPVEATANALQEHLPPGWSARGPDGGQTR